MCNSYTNIIGSLVGVFVGWLLSRIGRVRYFFSNCSIKYFENDNAGSYIINELNENSDYGKFFFNLDISNTSLNKRLLREIYCSIEVDKKIILKDIYDLDTYREVAKQEQYDQMKILSIASQDIIKIKLFVNLSKDDLAKIIDANAKIYFRFRKLWGLKRKKRKYISSLLKGKLK